MVNVTTDCRINFAPVNPCDVHYMERGTDGDKIIYLVREE